MKERKKQRRKGEREDQERDMPDLAEVPDGWMAGDGWAADDVEWRCCWAEACEAYCRHYLDAAAMVGRPWGT